MNVTTSHVWWSLFFDSLSWAHRATKKKSCSQRLITPSERHKLMCKESFIAPSLWPRCLQMEKCVTPMKRVSGRYCSYYKISSVHIPACTRTQDWDKPIKQVRHPALRSRHRGGREIAHLSSAQSPKCIMHKCRKRSLVPKMFWFGTSQTGNVRKADVRWLDNNVDFPCGIISSALRLQKKKCLTFYKLYSIFLT